VLDVVEAGQRGAVILECAAVSSHCDVWLQMCSCYVVLNSDREFGRTGYFMPLHAMCRCTSIALKRKIGRQMHQ
jgi:hypothetical protein